MRRLSNLKKLLFGKNEKRSRESLQSVMHNFFLLEGAMKTIFATGILLCLIFVGSSGSALAYPVVFNFAGITSDGDPFSGSYFFDSVDAANRDDITDYPFVSYAMTTPPYGLTVDIGGTTFSTTDSLAIEVLNDFLGVDAYDVFAVDAVTLDYVKLHLETSADVFSSDDLPLSLPPLDKFEVKTFTLVKDGTSVDGQLTRLVPEPGTGLLLGVGLALVTIMLLHGRRMVV